MYLVYIDESGNTGLNLKDKEQPIFLLAALILHSSKWFDMERAFHDILADYFETDQIASIEVHVSDLKARRRAFGGISSEESFQIRDRMLQLLIDFEIPVIHRRIIKSKFSDFCEQNYGPGIRINPYIMALPFVCMEVDHYIGQQGQEQLGMFIFDEQKKNLLNVERSLRTLRMDPNSLLKTSRIIEKGFFVDSSKCFAIQLTDLAAHYIRKREEDKLGFQVSLFDKQTFDKIATMTSTGVGSIIQDVLEWVKSNFIK